MPGYEREQMVNRILSFYARLPKETERPFTDDFFHDDARIELAAALEDTETAAELVEKMDAALASLPLDFEGYEAKVQFLVDLHGYVEGTYTIFRNVCRKQRWKMESSCLCLIGWNLIYRIKKKKEH